MNKHYDENMHQAKYGRCHRFDPDSKWSATEEKNVRCKVSTCKVLTCSSLGKQVDQRVLVLCWMMVVVALELNRRNINQAMSNNLLPELVMDTNDFNYGQTIFLVSSSIRASFKLEWSK